MLIGESESYSRARAVEAAIKEAAKKAALASPTIDTNRRIHLEYFNRFLSRVFSDGEDSEWVLKGGTGILARVPATRSTRDIDLFRERFTLDQALADFRRLAAVDLGDFFRFEYVGHEATIATEDQPYTSGYSVSFNIFIGVESRGVVRIDLAVGAEMTTVADTTLPASALNLRRLVTNPYRLYPIVDQIADKVCATMADYDGRFSSREKDLVDLVVFAVTQDIDGADLSIAIDTERRRRKMEPFKRFVVPSTWGIGYVKQSKTVPFCVDFLTVELARVLAARLINPALEGKVRGKFWSSSALEWR